MTNKSKLECVGEDKAEAPNPEAAEVIKEQTEAIPASESPTGNVANNSRRAGLSKREIMEELSRQRFPWDE